MKQGFMLIELIVASLVASMVAAILLAALAQSNRFQTVDDNMIDTSTRIAVISNQLEKDLMGAFVPTQAEEKKESSATQSAEASAKEEKKAPKIIEKIFYSTNKNGQLDTLTFVTNNPLVVYVGKDVGVVKPKVVRVQYTLRPEAEKKDSFALFRQESMELDLENYKNVTAYEVIGGIKSCTITFTSRIEKKKDEKAEKPSSQVLYSYKTLNDWVSEQKKEEGKEKTEFPRIPYQVAMKLVLWDLQDKKEKEFALVYEISTDFSPSKKQDKKEPEKPKKDENKEQPEDKNKPQPQKVAQNKSTTKEIVTITDVKTGKVVFQAEKNENTMNEIAKMFGKA